MTTLGSCVSLLPLSPLPAATSIPVVFFGIGNTHFIIFSSLDPADPVKGSHLHYMGTKHMTSRQAGITSNHLCLQVEICMNYTIVLTDKKSFLFQFLRAPCN